MVPIEVLHWPRVGSAGSVGCPNMLGNFIIFCSGTNYYVNNSYKDVKVCGSSSDILKAQKERDACCVSN